MFAPSIFQPSERTDAHYVFHQPQTSDEIDDARAALIACPVAAIRVDPKADDVSESTTITIEGHRTTVKVADEMAISPKLNSRSLPFPRPIAPGVQDAYHVGHHSEHSFGAVPYLVRGQTSTGSVWVMVDTPKFGASAKHAITERTGEDGPDYLLMTHVDDTAHHEEWAKEFPKMKQIFHAADLGRFNWIGDTALEQVDILLKDTSTAKALAAFTIDGTPFASLQQAIDDSDNELIILHTPGHSPGSISLWKKPRFDEPEAHPGILFTGDTYGYSRWRQAMSGFPRYGRSLSQQADTLQLLLQNIDWQIIAPGHGHSRDYRHETDSQALKKVELEQALEQFKSYRR